MKIPRDFDPIFYLMKNKDVVEHHIDPRDHFLKFGMHEGRSYKKLPLSKKFSNDLNPGVRVTVYGANMGGYDRVIDPIIDIENIDFNLFVDEIPSYKHELKKWKLNLIEPSFSSRVRSAREVKLSPFERFGDHYDYAIWIDSNVSLKVDPSFFIADMIAKRADIAFIKHPIRDCFYEESFSCINANKDDKKIIDEQSYFYKSIGIKQHEGMLETNFFIVNLKSPSARIFFNYWRKTLHRFSYRDQLAVAFPLHFMSKSISIINLLDDGECVRTSDFFRYWRH